MASSPTPPDPSYSAASAADRLSRAREILADAGRPTGPRDLALRTGGGALEGEPGGDAPGASEASAGGDDAIETPPPTPERAGRASTLAFAIMTGAVRPFARAETTQPGAMSQLATKLFPAAPPGEPSRLELAALGTALVGAAFIGTTIPGGSPVQAQPAPQAAVLLATTPPVTPTPEPAAAADTSSTSSDASTAATTAAASTALATPAVATPAAAAADSSTTDTTTDPSDAGDGTDPLAGGTGGTTLARVALVVVHGDAPVRWATAADGTPARKRAALGTTFTGLATLPAAPLATGLGYVAGQPANPATRAGCTAPTPVSPGTVDEAGVTAGTGCDYPAETASLPGAIARDGRTWKAYAPGASSQEVASRLCHPTDGDDEARRAFAQRSPLGHLGDLTASGACDAAAAPLSSLKADLTSDAPPAWVYIEVGDCGTDGCDEAEAKARDAALDEVLATLSSTAAPDDGKSAALVVGDGDGDTTGLTPADAGTYPAAPGDPAAPAALTSGALLVGDDVKAGGTDPIAIEPFAIARTQATWLGLTAPGLGAADGESALALPGA